VRTRLRIALLAAWSGSLVAYALLAIGPAFEVGIPTPTAARLLRRGFDGLDRMGMLVGLLCGALSLPDLLRRRRTSDGLRTLVPLLASAGHALSYFWITPELDALREIAGGSVGQFAEGHPGIARFAELHELSRALYIGSAVAGLACCVWDIFARVESDPCPRSAQP
jgi:hypothetical protein